MPDPKNNTKMTGDTHLPDTESEFNVEEANPQGAGHAATRDRRQSNDRRAGVTGRGGKKAGVLKDPDAQSSGSDGETRDSGEQ